MEVNLVADTVFNIEFIVMVDFSIAPPISGKTFLCLVYLKLFSSFHENQRMLENLSNTYAIEGE